MYKVRIDSFEGPFDLLVYLLENAKMDIYHIRIAEITEQYLAYLREMDELNVNIGSEFIVLAAVLIRLKSERLLPRAGESEGEVTPEDPAEELTARLEDYLLCKKQAELLAGCRERQESVYEKPCEDLSQYVKEPEEILRSDSDHFVQAFLQFLRKKERVREVRKRYQRIRRQRASLEDRIAEMTNLMERRFSQGEDKFAFGEILPEHADRYDVTLSFMSLLEMVKLQQVDAVQEENYGTIRILQKKEKKNSDV